MLEDTQLAEIFLSKGLVDESTIAAAKSLSSARGKTLYEILLSEKMVDEEKAIVLVSKELKLPCVSLKEFEAKPFVLDLIPKALAERYGLMPLGVSEEEGENKLFVAMANPLDIDAIEEVTNASGYAVTPLLAGPLDIAGAVTRIYTAARDEQAQESDDGLGAMLEGLFDDSLGDPMSEHKEKPAPLVSAATPQRPVDATVDVAAGKGFSLDFGDLGLSVERKSPKAVGDVHQRRTLPAGTELPPVTNDIGTFKSKEDSRPPTTAVRPRDEELVSLTEEQIVVTESAGFGGFGDLGHFDLDDDPREHSNPASSRPPVGGRTENSTIRYVADPSLHAPRKKFPYNIPSSDLAYALASLLLKHGLLSEKEIREEIRKKRR